MRAYLRHGLPYILLAASLSVCAASHAQSIPEGAPVPREMPSSSVMVPAVQDTPMVVPQIHMDVVELKREADQLAEMSQSALSEIKAANRGALPADLLEHLKKVEKLSKHLRSQLQPRD